MTAVDELYALVREARTMIPHADEPSQRRAEWCNRADVLLAEAARAHAASDEPKRANAWNWGGVDTTPHRGEGGQR